MEYRDKKITVVGLARSGAGAANILARMGALVTVTDSKTQEALSEQISKLDSSIRLVLGSHPEEVFLSADLVVVSPGVPLETGPIAKARELGIPVIGELELAFRIAMHNSKACFIAITGSNGKSTTTTLVDHMLRKSGTRTLMGGNIGNALTEEFLNLFTADNQGVWPDKIVAEVSSFQLESISEFRPHIAAILNITPDHMDRYHSLQDYTSAKARIALNQKETDYLVLNADDPETMKLAEKLLTKEHNRPQLVFFSRLREVKGIYLKGNNIFCNLSSILPLSPAALLINADEICIQGVHNLENAMAASVMALLAGCPANAVTASLREFRGLEHRLEFVREFDGVRYINDSKGTNVGAVMKSLESFREPVVLIAGGRDKEGDFAALRPLVKERVKALVLIGEAAEKIKGSLEGLTDTVFAKDLSDAVRISHGKASRGDVVLLSPACASFDMFRDFEDRGRQFKLLVKELGL